MTTRDKFFAAVEIINSLPRNGTFQPSDDLLLKLYAYQKQATDGPCNTPKPSIWDMSFRNKWNAWNDLGSMSKETAMEKYIEELKKVIETMSYNEKVSKFMSLIGPFYEVVSADEIDMQSEKLNNPKHVEYTFPRKALESLQIAENRFHSSCANLKINDESMKVCLSKSCTASSLRESCSSLSSDLDEPEKEAITKRNAVDFFKAKSHLRNSPFTSEKDILILTLINLQSSMEEIVKKFDRMVVLAKASNFKENQVNRNSSSDEWNLNITGTAFALLWPIAVHLYFGGL